MGVKPSRDRFIAMHMADPTGAEDIIGKMPILGGPTLDTQKPATPPAEITSLNAEQVNVARMLGIPTDAYLATLKAEAKETV